MTFHSKIDPPLADQMERETAAKLPVMIEMHEQPEAPMTTEERHSRVGVTLLRAAVASVFVIHGLTRTILGAGAEALALPWPGHLFGLLRSLADAIATAGCEARHALFRAGRGPQDLER